MNKPYAACNKERQSMAIKRMEVDHAIVVVPTPQGVSSPPL